MILFLSLFLFISNIVFAFSFPDTTIVNTDTTSIILLTFSEPMNIASLTNKANYSVKDSSTQKNYKIYKVGIPVGSNNKVILFCERLPYKKTAIITVTSVTDTAGNVISAVKNKFYYYHKGLKQTIPKPKPIVK